ncbi:hypothetical protein PT974_10507 [Cladobotryum mycophilum]|uniref:Uncharacterized protein n=1 Tax=Cladobotryum mycophilum TaxID=491253 RepID=A0ABR0SA24_9HYPO
MHFTTLISVAFAVLAAAEDYNGILYSGVGFTGESQAIAPKAGCVELTGDVLHNVRSLKIHSESICVLFYTSTCQGDGSMYFHDTDDTSAPYYNISSVKCQDQTGA